MTIPSWHLVTALSTHYRYTLETTHYTEHNQNKNTSHITHYRLHITHYTLHITYHPFNTAVHPIHTLFSVHSHPNEARHSPIAAR